MEERGIEKVCVARRQTLEGQSASGGTTSAQAGCVPGGSGSAGANAHLLQPSLEFAHVVLDLFDIGSERQQKRNNYGSLMLGRKRSVAKSDLFLFFFFIGC